MRMADTDPEGSLRLVDSALRLTNDEAARVRLLLLRQQAYAGMGRMDSVISTGVQVRRHALLMGDSLSIAKSLLPVRGEVSMEDQHELEPFLPGAARAFASRNMRYEEAVIEGLIGGIDTRNGMFEESMQHLYRARDIHEGLDSIKPLFAVYMNIGNNLSGMGQQQESIGFYEKACGVARRLNDSIRIATSLMNEGVVLSDLRIFDSSRVCLLEALAALPTSGAYVGYTRMQINYNLATLSLRQGRLDEAEAAYRSVVSQAEASGDPYAIGMAKVGLVGVLRRKGRIDAAIDTLTSIMRQQEAMGVGYYVLDHTRTLIEMCKEAGRYPEALAASERLKSLSDSILTADKQKAVQELAVKYDFEKQEKEKARLQEKLRQRNLTAVTLVQAVLVLSILGFVLGQRNRYQRRLSQSYERLLETYRAKRDGPDADLPPPVVRNPDEQSVEEQESHSIEGLYNDEVFVPNEEQVTLHQSILAYFNTEKPYLNPELKLEDLALHFDVPPRKITDAIRAATGQGYPDYVNRFRIAEATRIMDAHDNSHIKLEVIANQCGFRSRQYFRRVFEQVTGVNPSQYRRIPSDRQMS